ncbi:MAG: AbrB/MazE/SpoVT family DNA-binding domain-containing protein [Candidatus Dormibacterales bacterium]
MVEGFKAVRTRIGAGGRLVIPAEFRRRHGLGPGAQVMVKENADGDLVVTTPESALARLQARVRRQVPERTSLVDELLAERRIESDS